MPVKKHKILTMDGQELLLRCVGTGNERRAVVLLHGMGGDQEAWVGVIEQLQRQERATDTAYITYDLRGHGHSARVIPLDRDLFQTHAEDLKAVLDFLVHEQKFSAILLVGHCFGSFVAQRYLSEVSCLQVQKALLISGPSRCRGVSLPAWMASIFSVLPQLPLRHRTWEDHRQFVGSADMSLWRIYSDLRSVGVATYLTMEWMMLGRPAIRNGRRISTPIYIAAGEQDTFFPLSVMKAFSQRMQAKQFYLIPQTNHIVPVSNPSAVASIIESLL